MDHLALAGHEDGEAGGFRADDGGDGIIYGFDLRFLGKGRNGGG
ncbi:MAG: hypothetical protein Q27BPR15_01450 [Rhodobacter sp. CACIA14H1]|nr:MAG: hypothetical protein Q27BPR15_01450 [Rhodobacter sp. CACIA14H1]